MSSGSIGETAARVPTLLSDGLAAHAVEVVVEQMDRIAGTADAAKRCRRIVKVLVSSL
jgi:hypothetical protein